MQQVKRQVLSLMQKLDFPCEAIEPIAEGVNKIFESKGVKILQSICSEYQNDCCIDADFISQQAKKISKLSGVGDKQCNLVIYLALVESLNKHYIDRGYPLEIFNDTIKDLKGKLIECHFCFNVWGIKACASLNPFFALTRFGIGVLQFEVIKFDKTAKINGVVLGPNDDVINIHIPRLDLPFTAEARKSSYLRAKEFFGKRFLNKDKVVFHCHSWLLFKKHREMLKPNSNILSFINEFTLYAEYQFDDYSETWRIFNKCFTKPEEMPANNSMQKAYLEIIKRGEKTGGSEGVFFL